MAFKLFATKILLKKTIITPTQLITLRTTNLQNPLVKIENIMYRLNTK